MLQHGLNLKKGEFARHAPLTFFRKVYREKINGNLTSGTSGFRGGPGCGAPHNINSNQK